jgi:hypothetical protein
MIFRIKLCCVDDAARVAVRLFRCGLGIHRKIRVLSRKKRVRSTSQQLDALHLPSVKKPCSLLCLSFIRFRNSVSDGCLALCFEQCARWFARLDELQAQRNGFAPKANIVKSRIMNALLYLTAYFVRLFCNCQEYVVNIVVEHYAYI